MKLIQNIGPIEYTTKNGNLRKDIHARFKCEICGDSVTKVIHDGIKAKSCGSQYCVKVVRGNTSIDAMKIANVSHGKSGSKIYNVWQAMRQRCYNPKNRKYSIYGGKGIEISDNWKTFESFYSDMGEEYEKQFKEYKKLNDRSIRDIPTIDRIDSSKNYCVENCQWISLHDNSKKDCIKAVRRINNSTEVRFESAAEAARLTNKATPGHITACCQGKRNSHAGFKWQYDIMR